MATGYSEMARPLGSTESPDGSCSFRRRCQCKGVGQERSLKNGATRKTRVIYNTTGEIRELEDDWRQVGPLTLDEEWTGWTEIIIIEEDADMEATVPLTRTPPPASAAVKRASKEMSGEIVEDKQTEKAPLVDNDDEEMSEARQGINLLGFCSEVVNLLRGSNMDIIKEVNEIRRAVR